MEGQGLYRYPDGVRIGELAERSGVSTKTIRFWEDRGLVPPPSRTESGYRDYAPGTERTLQFVRSAQSAGFTLAEIGGIIGIRSQGDAPCEHVTDLIHRHLGELDGKIHELQALRAQLGELAILAGDLDPADCDSEVICRILTQNTP